MGIDEHVGKWVNISSIGAVPDGPAVLTDVDVDINEKYQELIDDVDVQEITMTMEDGAGPYDLLWRSHAEYLIIPRSDWK